MTLLELTKAVEGVAKLQPAVKMIVPEDIFRLSNEMSAKYGVFAWTQGAHSVDVESGMAIYTLTLFYVDRLLEDKTNAVEIHSVGVGTLTNVVRGVVDNGDVWVDTALNFTTFSQRFADECAGVFATVQFKTYQNSICVEN